MQGGQQRYAFTVVDVQSAPHIIELGDTLEDYEDDHPAQIRLAEIGALCPHAV